MNDPIREAFEKVTAPTFGCQLAPPIKNKGVYSNPILEDHWQTFQEGWEEAIKYLTNKNNPCYSDLISGGGIDPRK